MPSPSDDPMGSTALFNFALLLLVVGLELPLSLS